MAKLSFFLVHLCLYATLIADDIFFSSHTHAHIHSLCFHCPSLARTSFFSLLPIYEKPNETPQVAPRSLAFAARQSTNLYVRMCLCVARKRSKLHTSHFFLLFSRLVKANRLKIVQHTFIPSLSLEQHLAPFSLYLSYRTSVYKLSEDEDEKAGTVFLTYSFAKGLSGAFVQFCLHNVPWDNDEVFDFFTWPSSTSRDKFPTYTHTQRVRDTEAQWTSMWYKHAVSMSTFFTLCVCLLRPFLAHWRKWAQTIRDHGFYAGKKSAVDSKLMRGVSVCAI